MSDMDGRPDLRSKSVVRRYPERSPYAFTDAKLKRWTKEGRGAGEGASYRPWLECRNVRSRGRKHRLPGMLHDRVMHLMSDLERNAVLFFERDPRVLDLREQYPLDREITRAIARELGTRHPRDPATGTDIVMTTDLLVTFNNGRGSRSTRAFSVKPAGELLDHRIVIKQEMERRYWERLGIVWRPLLDTTLRRREYFNAVLWAREWFRFPTKDASVLASWARRCASVEAELMDAVGTLGDVVRSLSAGPDMNAGEVLSSLRHLVATGRVRYDFALGVPTLDAEVSAFIVSEAGLRKAA